jgi:hypothetical protein
VCRVVRALCVCMRCACVCVRVCVCVCVCVVGSSVPRGQSSGQACAPYYGVLRTLRARPAANIEWSECGEAGV